MTARDDSRSDARSRAERPAEARGAENNASAGAHDRFAPRAAREMAGMFDGVSGRYDLLNRLMTLGLDEGWREDLADAVPEDASRVLDLCTGNGVSAEELRKTGRTVVGLDVSLGMLRDARASYGFGAWPPQFACADAFRLPMRDASVDAVTVAFGMRNLRPREDALAEIARVLKPGGSLCVLEATGPSPGPIGHVHGLWVRHVIPLLGRLSPDPSAYRYLSASIFEFGDGSAFHRDVVAAGFRPCGARRFLMGAAALFVAEWQGVGEETQRRAIADEDSAAAKHPRRAIVQNATVRGPGWGKLPHAQRGPLFEWRLWNALKLAIAVAIVVTLALGFGDFMAYAERSPLAQWQRVGTRILLIGGLALFGARALLLVGRLLGRPPRR